jgi:hypothetical protein
VAKVVLGLVGEKPDLSAWLEAIAGGSFELRPAQDYAHSTELKSRARLLSRQQNNLDKFEHLRRAWAAEADASHDAVRLIAASALLRELRKNVAAKAALGPAWPLMVAVNDHLSADEKRLLHRFGKDPAMIRCLAKGVELALKRFLERHAPDESATSIPAGEWRRRVPPKVDVVDYFASTGATASDQETTSPSTIEHVERQILSGPKPSFLVDAKIGKAAFYSPTRHQLAMMLPAHDEERAEPKTEYPTELEAEAAAELKITNAAKAATFAKAVRALMREQHRAKLVFDSSPIVDTDDFRVQVWLKNWAAQGGGLPSQLPVRLFNYLEEEVCLAYETQGADWPGCGMWRLLKVIGPEPSGMLPATLPPEYWAEDSEFTWVKPPRTIDRIIV